MDPNNYPFSRTSPSPEPASESSARATLHTAHRRHDAQYPGGSSRRQLPSNPGADERGEPFDSDGEETDTFENHRRPIDDYYSLSNATSRVAQSDGSRLHEVVPAALHDHGDGELANIQSAEEGVQSAAFEPIPPPEGYAPLSFRPTLLRTKWTATLAILYLAIATCIYVLLRASGPDYLFTVSNENVHLIARYGPGLTATLTVLFFRQTVRDTIRMKPFFAMADQNDTLTQGATPRNSVAGSYFPFQAPFMTPPSFISIFLFLGNFVVAFLVAFKSILLGTEQSGSDWKVTVRTSAAIYLIAGYGLMALVNVVIITWAWSRSTGLKWDPVSLADYFALFARCNALESFSMLEHDWKDDKLRSPRKTRAFNLMSSKAGYCFRIGYWISRPQNQEREENTDELNPEIVYGVGLVKSNRPISILGTRVERKQYLRTKATDKSANVHNVHNLQSNAPDRNEQEDDNPEITKGSESSIAEPCSCKTRPRCQHYPYRAATGLQIPILIFWILIATAASLLCILGLGSGAVVRGGFSIDAWTHVANSSSAGNTTSTANGHWYNTKSGSMLIYATVFRGLPTQLAGQFAIAYLPTVDTHMRFTQPFVGMFDEAGDAADTIALSYLTASSLKVPLDAFEKGHWKVAWFATLATLAPLFPVLVSALFTITESGSKVYLALDWPTFAMVAGYILIFNVSLPLAWPKRSRRQPRYIYSLADIMGLCHQARFLADPLFDIASPGSSKEKMDARLLLRENKYLLGQYRGRDDKTHLGFDVSETDVGGPTGTVDWIAPKVGFIRRAERKPSLLERLFQKKHSKLEQQDPEDGMKMQHIRNRSGPSNGEQDDQSD